MMIVLTPERAVEHEHDLV
jgi:hypothetical protein